MSELVRNKGFDFNQSMALALAGNQEFVKLAQKNYTGKFVGYCVSAEILRFLECTGERLK